MLEFELIPVSKRSPGNWYVDMLVLSIIYEMYTGNLHIIRYVRLQNGAQLFALVLGA